MYAPEDRKAMLVAMRKDIVDRLESAKADLDAVDRLIAVQEDMSPPLTPATVDEVRQAAVEILNDHGDKMHRRDILSEMTERGVHVGGRVPVNNLGSVLSRFGDVFESHGQGVWGLKSWKTPSPANTTRTPLIEGSEERRTFGESLTLRQRHGNPIAVN